MSYSVPLIFTPYTHFIKWWEEGKGCSWPQTWNNASDRPCETEWIYLTFVCVYFNLWLWLDIYYWAISKCVHESKGKRERGRERLQEVQHLETIALSLWSHSILTWILKIKSFRADSSKYFIPVSEYLWKETFWQSCLNHWA